MALKIYDTLAPQGDYPAACDKDISVAIKTSEVYDLAAQDGDLLRNSFHLGNRISLGSHSGYRINQVGIRAAAGTTARFALYAMEQETEDSGVMTCVATLGDAVADSENRALLTFDGGYEVRRDNTIILALAESADLHCSAVGSGVSISGVVQFDDGNYFSAEDGSQIPYTNGEAQGESAVHFAMCVRDIELFTEQRLDDYIKTNEKRLGEVAQGAVNALPAVTALDNGKFLRVADGAWAAAAVDNAEGVSF